MVKRWLAYLAVWFCCLMLYLVHRNWVCCILFIAATALPPVSLLLMRRPIQSAQAAVNIPEKLTRGTPAAAAIEVTCRGPIPQWQAVMTLQHSFSGEKRRIKPSASLPTDHCGLLQLRIRGIYLQDYMGLFRFRLAGPRQIDVAVRPNPIAPDTLPELGRHLSVSWRPRRGGGYSENHDLRLYRPGDSLQQIHWKLSAKTGSLILREPLEPLHSRLLLRLDLQGSPMELDEKLGRLLWLSTYLLDKGLPHHWQVLTGLGIRAFAVCDEGSMYAAMDSLLGCPPATEGTVLDTPAQAAWWHYIGGDSHETP